VDRAPKAPKVRNPISASIFQENDVADAGAVAAVAVARMLVVAKVLVVAIARPHENVGIVAVAVRNPPIRNRSELDQSPTLEKYPAGIIMAGQPAVIVTGEADTELIVAAL